MALSQSQIEALPEALVSHFQSLESDIVLTIVKHISDLEKLTATDIIRLNELQRIGFNLQEIRKAAEESLSLYEGKISDIFMEASRMEYEKYKTVYDLSGAEWIPFSENEALQELVIRTSRATAETFNNISASQMLNLVDRAGNLQSLAETYVRTIDYAIMQIQTGQTDFFSAIRRSILNLSDGGARVVWESGYSQRLDTAVRRNILGGLANLSLAQSQMNAELIDADGMEITFHTGHRPTHDFGGQQYTIKAFQSDILPLMEEPNCYHRAFPVILNLMPPAYSKSQLDVLRAEEERIRYFEDRPYDRYAAEQKQRRYETEIRRQKDRVNTFRELGDQKSLLQARTRVTLLTESYRDFSDAMGIRTVPERASIPRIRRS